MIHLSFPVQVVYIKVQGMHGTTRHTVLWSYMLKQVSSVATARAPLAGPGGPSGPLADAAAADEEDDGVIRSGVGSPVHSSRKAAHQSQVDSFMLQHNIKIQYSGSQDVPMPVLTMDQVPFNPSIMKSVSLMQAFGCRLHSFTTACGVEPHARALTSFPNSSACLVLRETHKD